jgi:phosphonatase-like hydrolase
MSIQLVVFDIAGTTVADKGNINEVFRQAFASVGLNTVNEKDVDAVMGYRKKEAIKIIVSKYKPGFENDEEFIESIHGEFSDRMISFYETDEELKPLPFAEKAFRELKSHNVKVALNTGFTRAITTPILKRLAWDHADFIDEVICSDEVEEGRPQPFMMQTLMQKLKVTDADDVAKVGDTKVDILEGINAGCGLVIAITTGAYKKEELLKYHPDYVIDSLEILPSLIL